MPKTSTRNKHRIDGSQARSKQKLFQCTGFGDCKMVFTRSEHLARHARKHTGEVSFPREFLEFFTRHFGATTDMEHCRNPSSASSTDAIACSVDSII